MNNFEKNKKILEELVSECFYAELSVNYSEKNYYVLLYCATTTNKSKEDFDVKLTFDKKLKISCIEVGRVYGDDSWEDDFKSNSKYNSFVEFCDLSPYDVREVKDFIKSLESKI